MKWFEKRGTLLTLVYLYKVRKANQTQIADAISVTKDTLRESVLPKLKKQGLIKGPTKNTEFPFSYTIELTEKGKKLAHHLSESGAFS